MIGIKELIHDINANLCKEINILKRNHSEILEMKNSIYEGERNWESHNSFCEAEKVLSNLEDKSLEIS